MYATRTLIAAVELAWCWKMVCDAYPIELNFFFLTENETVK